MKELSIGQIKNRIRFNKWKVVQHRSNMNAYIRNVKKLEKELKEKEGNNGMN